MRICKVKNCGRKHFGKGLCMAHYHRVRDHGNLNENVPIKPSGLSAEERFWSKVDKTSDCWTWTAHRDKDGYGTFRIRKTTDLFPKETTLRANRVAFTLTHKRIPELNVLHTCDNPPCVRPEHLFEGTHKDNKQDCIAKGRLNPSKGEKHMRAKFKNKDIAVIRQRLNLDKTMKNRRLLAKEYNVALSTINGVYYGYNWKI